MVDDSRRRGLHSYALVMGAEGAGVPHTVEFEAAGAEAALFAAQRLCQGREAELFEDGRSLGRLRNDAEAGFWMLTGKPKPTEGRPNAKNPRNLQHLAPPQPKNITSKEKSA